MTIPTDLKIFSFIYEYRLWVLVPLYTVWIIIGFHFLIRLKKVFFLWLLIFPLLLSPLNIAFVYSGWHYRMELRDRFARDKTGWSDPYTGYPINLNVMPPEILAEYAKHDYHPRFRDMKAMFFGTIVLTPFLFALGGLSFLIIIFIRKLSRINMPE